MTRIAAIDAAYLSQHPAPGGMLVAEKGCLLSHRGAIEESLAASGHALILEDDAMFGPRSCARIDGALSTLAEDDWGLIFTDVVIFHPPLMTGLLHMRRELAQGGGQMLMNLTDITFCGATAYVVNQRFKERLLALLDRPSLDVPYDAVLRDLIKEGKIRAFVICPFATSLSHFADRSQIQVGTETVDMVWNSFRRFIWVDRDLASATAKIDQLGSDFMDEESAAFSRIVGTALSTRLVLK